MASKATRTYYLLHCTAAGFVKRLLKKIITRKNRHVQIYKYEALFWPAMLFLYITRAS